MPFLFENYHLEKEMLQKNQAPGLMLQNGRQKLLGHLSLLFLILSERNPTPSQNVLKSEFNINNCSCVSTLCSNKFKISYHVLTFGLKLNLRSKSS